jgi:WD40 repeat protein
MLGLPKLKRGKTDFLQAHERAFADSVAPRSRSARPVLRWPVRGRRFSGSPSAPEELRYGAPVQRAVLTTDGRLVETARAHGTIRRWDVRTGAPGRWARPGPGNPQPGRDVAAAAVGRDSLGVWRRRSTAGRPPQPVADVEAGLARRTSARGGNRREPAVAYDLERRTDLSRTSALRLRVVVSPMDPRAGDERRRQRSPGDANRRATRVHRSSPMSAAAFSADGRLIATGDDSGNVVVWTRDGSAIHAHRAHANGECTRVRPGSRFRPRPRGTNGTHLI